MNDKERNLILSAQNGDHFAFEQLVSNYDRQVLKLAYSMVGNVDDAQDVYQEALISAYRSLPKFKMKSNFFTWLYRIAVNKAINFNRQKMRHPLESITFENSDSLGYEQSLRTTPNENPEASVVNNELKEIIEEAVANISSRERMAFVLCHQQGYKLKEASKLMECSIGAVKSYLFRAREKLKVKLKKYMEL